MTSRRRAVRPFRMSRLTSHPEKKRRKWGIRFPWLYLPLAVVFATVLGVAAMLIFFGLYPGDRSLALGILVIGFPCIGGVVLNFVTGHRSPRKALLGLVVISLLTSLIAYLIN